MECKPQEEAMILGVARLERESCVRQIMVAALAFCMVGSAFAQDKLPPRFEPLLKNEHFRLTRVLGMPELRPTLGPTSAISADGKWALFAEDLSSGDGEAVRLRTRLLLYDLQAKTWPREFDIEGKSVTALDLAADGGTVILACQSLVPRGKAKNTEQTARGCLVLFDLRAGKAVRTVAWDRPPAKKENVADAILAVAFAPDASVALAGSFSQLRQFPLGDGKSEFVYDPEHTAAAAIAFLPGGKRFLVGDAQGQVRLFDLGKSKPVQTFKGMAKAGFISHLAISPDGKRFAVGTADGGVWAADLANRDKLLVDQGRNEFVAALALAGDGKTVVAALSKLDGAPDGPASRLVALDADTGKTLWSKTTDLRGVVPIMIQKDTALIGGGPNLLEIRSLKDGRLMRSEGGHVGAVTALAVLADGDILSAGPDGYLLAWRKEKLVSRSGPRGGPISALVASATGKAWLEAGADLSLSVLLPGARRPTRIQGVHTASIAALAFSTSASWAASGSADRTAKTWDLQAAKEIATFAGHAEAVNAVAIAPDDRWLATGSDDTTIKLWPIKAGKLDPDRETITLEGHKKPVTCLAFAPDGKTLISGSQDQTLKVWDWAKEKSLRTITGHKNWITALLLLDAKTALTTSDDLTLRCWDLEAGKEIARLDFGVVGDCPRCLARLGPDRILVGSSSWLIYELQLQASK